MKYILLKQTFFLAQGVPGKEKSHKVIYKKMETAKPKQKTKKEIVLAYAQHS